ncbi:hypothetical protein NDU88_006029 [Pleurodeles waltl]|uniref:Uncharacterized protein n=1 Tax=Pleurodeles waltl TaxID=8319 RepID=A0AAV7SNE7_PLEWA|nr:hypothetical protein NDU88_006029 [Pleurodeles waltl]
MVEESDPESPEPPGQCPRGTIERITSVRYGKRTDVYKEEDDLQGGEMAGEEDAEGRRRDEGSPLDWCCVAVDSHAYREIKRNGRKGSPLDWRCVAVDSQAYREIKRNGRKGGGADTVGEDTEEVCMDAVEVSASEVCVPLGVVMMLVVDDDVVHAGVSVDVTR